MGRAKAVKTKDGMQILLARYIKGDPRLEAMFQEEMINAEIARQIYDLRTRAGLTQRELAKLAGTTASVICRLEDADYEGHSLTMLKRIAAVLNHRVEVRIVPVSTKSGSRAQSILKSKRPGNQQRVLAVAL